MTIQWPSMLKDMPQVSLISAHIAKYYLGDHKKNGEMIRLRSIYGAHNGNVKTHMKEIT